MRVSNRGFWSTLGGIGATMVSAAALAAQQPAQGKGITDVQGIRVGHYTMPQRPTGCTVILVDGEGAAGGVSQRGAAPGTRETDLLNPLNMVDKVNAIVLTGGSAYGLDAATGSCATSRRKASATRSALVSFRSFPPRSSSIFRSAAIQRFARTQTAATTRRARRPMVR